MIMGTEIFLFEPKGAEKMEIKDFNLHSEIMSITTFFYRVSHKIISFVLRAIAPSILSNIQK